MLQEGLASVAVSHPYKRQVPQGWDGHPTAVTSWGRWQQQQQGVDGQKSPLGAGSLGAGS